MILFGCTNYRHTDKVCTHRFQILTDIEKRTPSRTSIPLRFHNRSPLTLLRMDVDDAIVFSYGYVDLASMQRVATLMFPA